MPIPGYRVPWYRNPAFAAFGADVAIASVGAATATIAIRARNGSFYGPEGALVAILFLAAAAKAMLTWNGKGRTRSHQELEGCLQTLHHALLASSETGEAPGLRLTIYTPAKTNNGVFLEQVLDYVSADSSRRKGAGRSFSQHCGIIGHAYRTGEAQVASREIENQEEYVKELVTKWNYSDDQARVLDTRGWSFMAVPLKGDAGVEAILFIDSSKRNYFSKNRQDLVVSACSGIALFVNRIYNKNAD